MINSQFSVIFLMLFTFRYILLNCIKRSGHIAKTVMKRLVLIDVLSEKNKQKL